MGNKVKKYAYIVCCILLVVAIWFSVYSYKENQREMRDRKTAEVFVITNLRSLYYTPFSIEKTVYDKTEKKYIVYAKSIVGEGIFKKGIVEIENGEVVRFFDRDWDE